MPDFLKYFYVIVLFALISCDKDKKGDDDNFPSTPEEIEKAIETTHFIAEKGGRIIEDAIEKAYRENELMDVDKIVEHITQIEGVASANLSSGGSVIVVKQADGTYANLLLIDFTDDRLFVEDANKISVQELSFNNIKTLATEDKVFPEGNGKALILAPVQKYANTNIDNIEKILDGIGYKVDKYTDENADFYKFSGEFMARYDIVLVITHGASDCKTFDGIETPMIMTGEKYYGTYYIDDFKGLIGSISYDTYSGKDIITHTNIGISPKWIRETMLNTKFKNTWIFLTVCQSSKTGEHSFPKAFRDLGATGFNGYDDIINRHIGNEIALKMFSYFTSGLSFGKAYENVKNDKELINLQSYIISKVKKEEIPPVNINLFSIHSDIPDRFYIAKPPLFTEVKVSDITTSSAVFECDIDIAQINAPVKAHGFCWSDIGRAEIGYPGTSAKNFGEIKSQSSTVIHLKHQAINLLWTKYVVRPFYQTAEGYFYGPSTEFKYDSNFIPPSTGLGSIVR